MILKTLRPNKYVEVDGVKFAVRWTDVKTGTSFFIPCIDAKKTMVQVHKYFREEGWKLKYVAREENGYFGVRIWRIL